MSDSIHVRYKCANCGAMDSATEPHPPLGPLNCWSCRAGYQKSPDEMRKNALGMFRTDDHIWLQIDEGARIGKDLS